MATKKTKKRATSQTWTQAERRALGVKEVVSISLTAEEKAALDKLRGSTSRGEFIGDLLRSLH